MQTSGWEFTTAKAPELAVVTTGIAFTDQLATGQVQEGNVRFTNATVLNYTVNYRIEGQLGAIAADSLIKLGAIAVVDEDGNVLDGHTVSSHPAISATTVATTTGSMPVVVTYSGAATAQLVTIEVD